MIHCTGMDADWTRNPKWKCDGWNGGDGAEETARDEVEKKENVSVRVGIGNDANDLVNQEDRNQWKWE